IEDPSVMSVTPLQRSVLGGTVVRVFGHNFLSSESNNNGMFCMFGAVKVKALLETSTSLRCISPVGTAGKVQLAVGLNDWQVVMSNLFFDFIDMPSVSAIEPAMGPDIGGTVVKLYGNFPKSLRVVFCGFSDPFSLAVGTLVEEGVVSCVTPSHIPRQTVVTVSYDGQQFFPAFTSFFFYSQPVITEVMPRHFFSNQAFNVSVSTANLLDTTAIVVCKCSGYYGKVMRVNQSALLCSFPAIDIGGQAFIEISNNLQDFVYNTKLPVSFSPAFGITGMSPVVAVKNYNTEVRIRLTDSPQATTLSCVFGEIATLAAAMDNDTITCQVPSMLSVGMYKFTVLQDGEITVQSGKYFTVVDSVAEAQISPSIGPESGGWLVSIRSNVFVPGSLVCRFSTAVVDAVYFQSAITCSVPALSIGRHAVEVSANGADFMFVGYIDIYASPVIFNVSPNLLIMNSAKEIMQIAGSYVMVNASYCCEFDGASVPVQFHNSSLVTCVAPLMSEGGQDTVKLRVVQCDAHMSFKEALTQSPHAFKTVIYTQFGLVQSVSPLSVFIGNDTSFSIKVYGSRFQNMLSYICKWSLSLGLVEALPAVFMSPDLLECPVPHTSISVEEDSVLSIIASDAILKTTTIQMRRVPSFSVIHPSEILEGTQTDVYLNLDNFYALDSAYCRFGSHDSTAAVVTVSQAGKVIVCKTPLMPPSSQEIFLSPSNKQFISTGRFISVLPMPTVLGLSPTVVHVGSKFVIVSGTNLNVSSKVLCSVDGQMTHPIRT
ncbi:hypothetical protein EON65_51365, partial [archaeon]